MNQSVRANAATDDEDVMGHGGNDEWRMGGGVSLEPQGVSTRRISGTKRISTKARTHKARHEGDLFVFFFVSWCLRGFPSSSPPSLASRSQHKNVKNSVRGLVIFTGHAYNDVWR